MYVLPQHTCDSPSPSQPSASVHQNPKLYLRGACVFRICVEDNDTRTPRLEHSMTRARARMRVWYTPHTHAYTPAPTPTSISKFCVARVHTAPATHDDADAEDDGREDVLARAPAPAPALLHPCECASAYAYRRSLKPACLLPHQVDAGITGTRSKVGRGCRRRRGRTRERG